MRGREAKVADAAHVIGGAWAGDVEWEGQYGACYCGEGGSGFLTGGGWDGRDVLFCAREGGWEVNELGMDLKYGS
jgi:hypothetical protein